MFPLRCFLVARNYLPQISGPAINSQGKEYWSEILPVLPVVQGLNYTSQTLDLQAWGGGVDRGIHLIQDKKILA